MGLRRPSTRLTPLRGVLLITTLLCGACDVIYSRASQQQEHLTYQATTPLFLRDQQSERTLAGALTLAQTLIKRVAPQGGHKLGDTTVRNIDLREAITQLNEQLILRGLSEKQLAPLINEYHFYLVNSGETVLPRYREPTIIISGKAGAGATSVPIMRRPKELLTINIDHLAQIKKKHPRSTSANAVLEPSVGMLSSKGEVSPFWTASQIVQGRKLSGGGLEFGWSNDSRGLNELAAVGGAILKYPNGKRQRIIADISNGHGGGEKFVFYKGTSDLLSSFDRPIPPSRVIVSTDKNIPPVSLGYWQAAEAQALGTSFFAVVIRIDDVQGRAIPFALYDTGLDPDLSDVRPELLHGNLYLMTGRKAPVVAKKKISSKAPKSSQPSKVVD